LTNSTPHDKIRYKIKKGSARDEKPTEIKKLKKIKKSIDK
jgi:hypothetical protein